MAFNPFGLGFMIPSAEEIAMAIVSEEELRRSEEELRASMEKRKQCVIEAMNNDGYRLFLTLKDEGSKPIYPHISTQQEAEFLQRGEAKLCILFENHQPIWEVLRWSDESREEAKNPSYKRRVEKLLEVSKEPNKSVYVIGEGRLS